MQVLINHNITPSILNYTPCGLIMGQTGNGKTSLFNKMCGTTHASCAGKSSITQNLYRSPNKAGNHSFELIDTPGTQSTQETYKHAHLLRGALTSSELNALFIVMKYENRFETMLNKYLDDQQIVDKYDKNIVIIVTHADMSAKPEADFQGICEVMSDYCEHIIFYSEKSNSDSMADLMYACMSKMRKIKVEIDDEEFHLKFQLHTPPVKRQMRDQFNKYALEINNVDREFKTFAKDISASATANNEHIELLQAVIVEHKDQLETYLQQFQTTYGECMNDLDNFCVWIKLQKQIIEMCDQFSDFIMQFICLDARDQSDPRNIYKRCPNCRLVWVKVTGCDSVTCGARLEENERQDLTAGPLQKYAFKRIDGKISYTKHVVQKTILSGIFKMFSSNSNGIGCGTAFNWKTQAICLDAKEICDILTVKTIDEVKELIKSEKFNKSRNDYIKNIDSEFK